MAVTKLNFETKITNKGATSTGRLSADEFNLIPAKVDELVDDVNNKSTKITEVEGTANDAKTIATTAEQHATEAKTDSQEALTKANQALAGSGAGGTDLPKTEEDSFSVVDPDGNVGMKYDSNGLDAALLSSHLQALIKAIDGIGLAIGSVSGTAYDGAKGVLLEKAVASLQVNSTWAQIDESAFVVTDANGYIALKVNASGIDFAAITSHAKSLIDTGLTYEVVSEIDIEL